MSTDGQQRWWRSRNILWSHKNDYEKFSVTVLSESKLRERKIRFLTVLHINTYLHIMFFLLICTITKINYQIKKKYNNKNALFKQINIKIVWSRNNLLQYNNTIKLNLYIYNMFITILYIHVVKKWQHILIWLVIFVNSQNKTRPFYSNSHLNKLKNTSYLPFRTFWYD